MKVSRQSVADFYKLHHDKGKAFTVKNLKDSNFNKRTLYKIMTKFDENGHVERKPGSGRPPKMD